MHSYLRSFSIGLAMFSMFFGAGNVVFPLALGDQAGEHYLYAMGGLMLTAVGVPFLGLLAMTLYNGDYRAFFGQLGKWPGFLLTAVILGLLGPFGVIPRCFVVSYSSFTLLFPECSAFSFYLIASLSILALSYSKRAIVNLLGYVLTPVFMVLIGLVILLGLWNAPAASTSHLTAQEQFWNGMMQGYQTMDLLASFFFSSLIISTIRQKMALKEDSSQWPVTKEALKASCIGAALLGIVYVGFCYIAAMHHSVIDVERKEEILGKIALYLLGPYGGVLVVNAVILACMTTAMALAGVFAQFLSNDCSQGKLSYFQGLCVTVAITFGFSFLDFHGIAAFLGPILEVIYPGLIVLSIVGIIRKLPKKEPFLTELVRE